jgi:ABC-type nitrate/sulfonate/bicarbonate transport system permease component
MRSWPFDLFSTGFLVIVWALAAASAHSSLLPSPAEVLQIAWQESLSGRLPLHLGITFLRLAISFLLSMAVGSAIGIFLGRHPHADRFFRTWLTIALNIPALVSIILCYVWFGTGLSVRPDQNAPSRHLAATFPLCHDRGKNRIGPDLENRSGC